MEELIPDILEEIPSDEEAALPPLYGSLGTLSAHLGTFPWPIDFFSPGSLPEFLDRIHVLEYTRDADEGGTRTLIRLAIQGEVALSLPGVDGVKLVVGSDVAGYTFLHATLLIGAVNQLRFEDIRLALRFDPEVLTPAPDENGLVASHAQIFLEGSIAIDDAFDVTVEGFDAIQLTPVMVGTSGVVISAEDVKLDLSRTGAIPEVLAAGFDDSFVGVFIGQAKVKLPDGFPAMAPEDLVLQNCAIGSGGVSGMLEANYTPSYDPVAKRFTGSGAGDLFGIPFGLETVDISLRANAFDRARMSGDLLLPFFDEPVGVEIGFTLGGALTIDLSEEAGLTTITKPGVVTVTIDSLGFEVTGDALAIRLSGKVKPLFGGLAWPTFEVQDLLIDSEGNAKLDGGWLDLPEQYGFNFHGFGLAITKIGFGRLDDGSKWIGFSGALSLAAGLSAGASVQGLRIIFDGDGGPRITLEGVGIEFEIPEILRFKGSVSYREPAPDLHRFDGAIKLDLLALDLTVDGQLVIGSAADPVTANAYTFVAVRLGSELPAGIPLFSTGLSLYGIEGLFTVGLEPAREADQPWYEGWYKSPPVGATDLVKWTNRDGALAVGAGITVGTTVDNGHTFNAKTTLVLVFPGPILMLEGRASLFKDRSALSEPIFRALAVLDARTDSFLVGLDARYRKDSSGKLIDIQGSAEAFFSLSDGDAWHLYLGQKEPRDKRIRAQILSLFEANAYLMLDANQLAMGGWTGYDESWKFGPLKVGLEAWIDANAAVNWRPAHFHGDARLAGKAELSVYGFGASLSIEAGIAADVMTPFHLVGAFNVSIGLPWPLPDFDVDVTLEWGPEGAWPLVPAPLKEVAIEHFKVTTAWPLPRPTLLQPPIADEDGLFDITVASPASIESAPPPSSLPVVPVDSRPHITFARPVLDSAYVGVNGLPPAPSWEVIGDPTTGEGIARLRYSLQEVALHKWTGSTWALVARSAGVPPEFPDPSDPPRLFGSWAPVPNLPDLDGASVAQTKLWLWSKTPFDYTRVTGGEWAEWFSEEFENYPCAPIPGPTLTCYSFKSEAIGNTLATPWIHPDEAEVIVAWIPTTPRTVVSVNDESGAPGPGICLRFSEAPTAQYVIDVPEDNIGVRIGVRDPQLCTATALDANGVTHGPITGGGAAEPWVEFRAEKIRRVTITPNAQSCLYSVCVWTGLTQAEVGERQQMIEHMQGELERWLQQDSVLEPHTIYRLKLVTRVESETLVSELDPPPPSREHEQYAYFKTAGPPGIGELSTPTPPLDPQVESELGNLVLYVRQTIPASVPDRGRLPALAKPVYRAYDVSVEFNENYVDLMYRLAGRDLGLYFFDSNGRPARDAQRRLLMATYRWDVTQDLSVDEAEAWWIETVNASSCGSLDTSTIPHDTALRSEEHTLDPDTIYEARLIPLLLHDNFSRPAAGSEAVGDGATVGGWLVADAGTTGGPARWVTVFDGSPAGPAIAQTSATRAGSENPADPAKPGTILHWAPLAAGQPDQPTSWGDYRAAAFARSANGGAIGLAFRVESATRHYLFVMDRAGRYRRLLRVDGPDWTILAEDDFVYVTNRDYHLSVEVVGGTIRVFVDGTLVFFVEEFAPIAAGGVGLYCWNDPGARFKDVRIDDLRSGAPVVYKFGFTTSHYSSFFHQAHSYQDEIWPAPPAAELPPLLLAGSPPTAQPGDEEYRAYDAVAELVLGSSARRNPEVTTVTRLHGGDGAPLGFLIEGREPIDWRRLSIQVERHDRLLAASVPPASVKLTDVAVAGPAPSGERTTLLLREPTNLRHVRVDQRVLPGPLAEDAIDSLLFEDRFDDGRSGPLFEERFGEGALDLYTVIDEGTNDGPSDWAVSSGQIVQTSNIWGGLTAASELLKPGTEALVGDETWRNIRITTVLHADDNDGIGIVFRRAANGDRYRFHMDRERGFRRLVRITDAGVAVLWHDDVSYDLGRSYRLVIEAYESSIVGWLDDAVLFHVVDGSIQSGRVGFYSWANTGAHFEGLRVESIERPPILFAPTLVDLDGWTAVDAAVALEGPSAWSASLGTIRQQSEIYDDDPGPAKVGTMLIAPGRWGDMVISVRVRSVDDDAIGLVFRYTSEAHYYRFSMDAERSYRRLLRVADGVSTVLWEDAVAYAPGTEYAVTIRALGNELTGWIDGEVVFRVFDSGLSTGHVGLYTWQNSNAWFTRVFVLDPVRSVGGWAIRDEGTVGGPSVWRLLPGGLVQTSLIRGGAETPSAPEKPGTYAIAGDPSWGDVRVTVRLRSDEDGALGICFRWSDPSNHYRLSFDRAADSRRLVRVAGGEVTVLWESTGSYTAGQSFEVTVDAIGSRLVGSVDGTRLFDVSDDTQTVGAVALYAWNNGGARFERVTVEKPPLDAHVHFADRFGDGVFSEWTVVDEGTIGGPSAWTVSGAELRQTSSIHSLPLDGADPDKPGTLAVVTGGTWGDVVFSVRIASTDDNAIGVVFRHTGAGHYRFSMDRLRQYRRLVKRVGASVQVVWEDSVSFVPGRTYEIVIAAIGDRLRGWIDGVPIFDVVDASVTAGTVGLYTWNNVGARFSQLRVYAPASLFAEWNVQDGFHSLNTLRWTVADEGTLHGPSQWSAANGWLRQQAGIHGAAAEDAGIARPGTFVLTGESSWTDYRVAARLRSDGEGAEGIVFRYVDPANYYRFSLDREAGKRRLVSKVNGVFTLLWEAPADYVAGREYILTVDCVGARLQGWVDGARQFAIDHPSLSYGKVGLYSFLDDTARFTDARIGLARWTRYAAFVEDDVRPGGTQHEIAARRARFVGEDARLRVVHRSIGSDIVVHDRMFLDPRQYSPIPVRVLRKRDGTGFVVVPEVPGSLLPGEHRLILTYARSGVPGIPDLSQAGDATPEIAVLELFSTASGSGALVLGPA